MGCVIRKTPQKKRTSIANTNNDCQKKKNDDTICRSKIQNLIDSSIKLTPSKIKIQNFISKFDNKRKTRQHDFLPL